MTRSNLSLAVSYDIGGVIPLIGTPLYFRDRKDPIYIIDIDEFHIFRERPSHKSVAVHKACNLCLVVYTSETQQTVPRKTLTPYLTHRAKGNQIFRFRDMGISIYKNTFILRTCPAQSGRQLDSLHLDPLN